jgi:hypothetical protein
MRPAPPAGKSRSADTLALAPRVVADASDRQRGMHRPGQFARPGSRGPNARRGIATLDFRPSTMLGAP